MADKGTVPFPSTQGVGDGVADKGTVPFPSTQGVGDGVDKKENRPLSVHGSLFQA